MRKPHVLRLFGVYERHRFRNIKKIREIGEAVADGLQGQIDAPGQQDIVNGLAAVPIAVKNYLVLVQPELE